MRRFALRALATALVVPPVLVYACGSDAVAWFVRRRRGGAALVLLLALAVGGGCAPEGQQLAEKPNQAKALRIIWVDTFGQDIATAPAIDWRPSGEGGCDGGFRDGEHCLWDIMRPDTWVLSVSWEGSFARSELAHGACHARSVLLTGDIDADHQGECFLGGLANVAVGRLVAAGMGGGL